MTKPYSADLRVRVVEAVDEGATRQEAAERFAAIFSTVMLAGTPFLFRWMGGRDEMLSDALAYSNVALGGAVCICMLNLLGNTVRGTGNISLPATVMLGCVLAHIALAPMLIFGLGPVPALGPAGAAWGLVIPFGVGSVVMIGYLRSSRAIVRLVSAGSCRVGSCSPTSSKSAFQA